LRCDALQVGFFEGTVAEADDRDICSTSREKRCKAAAEWQASGGYAKTMV
jgi:hypothetical protein